jgi:hypothetical protein
VPSGFDSSPDGVEKEIVDIAFADMNNAEIYNVKITAYKPT